MRWIGNVVLLCLCLGIATAWPVMAQGASGNAAPDTATVMAGTTVRAPESRTRWAIQPFMGLSEEIGAPKQPVRFLPGMLVRWYPSFMAHHSIDVSAYFQIRAGTIEPGESRSWVMLDFNTYFLDKRMHKVSPGKWHPYATVGVGVLGDGWHSDDPAENTLAVNLGIGVEWRRNQRVTVPMGVYFVNWSPIRYTDGDESSIWYAKIGINVFLN